MSAGEDRRPAQESERAAGGAAGPGGSPTAAAVSFDGVSRAFGTKQALIDASFTVPAGSVCALLGPNGAGKTTSIRILLGLARADSGRIRVLGEEPGSLAARRLIGYLPDVPAFPAWMTGREYLVSCARLTSVPHARRVPALLELAGLASTEQPIGSYSRGMKQRLGLAQALIASPRLLVLDEPTSALDPAGRRAMHDLIERLAEHTTVILSSHNLAEAQRVCTHAVVLREGRVLASSPISQLRQRTGQAVVRIESDAPENLAAALADQPWAGALRREGATLAVTVLADEAWTQIPQLFARHGWQLRGLVPEEPSLEDAFLALTREGTTDACVHALGSQGLDFTQAGAAPPPKEHPPHPRGDAS